LLAGFLSARSRGIFARRGRFAGGTSSFTLGTGTALRLFGYRSRVKTLTANRLRRFDHNFGGEFPAAGPRKTSEIAEIASVPIPKFTTIRAARYVRTSGSRH